MKNCLKKLAGLPVFYSGSNESSLAPQFKWPGITFKHQFTADFVLASKPIYFGIMYS
jgi:hypothetical protein